MIQEITQFTLQLNSSLKYNYNRSLSNKQLRFVEACIWAIVWYGKLSWAAFGRFFLGISPQCFSYMLHRSSIPWLELYNAAVIFCLRQFGVTKLFISVDDTQRSRSGKVKKLWAFFKDLNRKTGGFGIFQNLVVIYLITDTISIPLMFAFYRPNPQVAPWKKQKKEAKKKGLPAPKKPPHNPKFPTRNEIAVRLISNTIEFINFVNRSNVRKIKIQATLADAAYFSASNVSQLRKKFPEIPMISQIKSNQIVKDKRGKWSSVKDYFDNFSTVTKTFTLRKGLTKNIEFVSARLFVRCHGCKIHIVAIRYEGEKSYRYLACRDLTWRQEDIIKAYAFRWLQEVGFEDWKLYDGWGKAASQQGEDGACRGVFLSFLVETFLVSHPMQLSLHRAGTGLCTSGSIVRQTQTDTFKWLIYEAAKSPDPKRFIDSFSSFFADLDPPRVSTKHMSGWDFDELGPSPSLQSQPKNRD